MKTRFISPQNSPISDAWLTAEAIWERRGNVYAGDSDSVYVQPMFRIKTDDTSENCRCVQAQRERPEWVGTCSDQRFRFNPALPGDRLAEFFIDQGWIPRDMAILEKWERGEQLW